MSSGRKVVGIEVISPGSSPDVDSDFNTEIRGDVIEHITGIFGESNVANIITRGHFAAKRAFKAMCTIYRIPFAEANKVSALIPEPVDGEPVTFSGFLDEDGDYYKDGAGFRNATAGSEWDKIIDGARKIEGKVSETGVHACGLIVSSQPLSGIIPTKDHQDGYPVTQFEYPACESLGTIKMDILGLDTVDIIQHTVENIMRSGVRPPNMLDVIHGSLDDPATFRLLQAGDTSGVFQLSSSGMRDLLRRLKPDRIDDIAAANALFRPGPMNLGSHLEFAQRKSSGNKGFPVHPEFTGSVLEEILDGTQNLIVYQEQVMEISNKIAGMTLKEGDELRKAMGKKKVDVMMKMRPVFFEGCAKNGYSEEAATALWDAIEKFAGYGFNKAHAYSYALTGYQAAYLKANYPAHFMATIIGQHMADKDKVRDYVKEVRRMGIKTSAPNINTSDVRVSAVAGTNGRFDIVFGLSGIKFVTSETAQAIINERDANGVFTDPEDLIARVPEVARKQVFENLVFSGALDCFNHSRRHMVEHYPTYAKNVSDRSTRGADLFEIFNIGEDAPRLEELEEYSYVERLSKEADSIGIYITGNPLDNIKPNEIKRMRTQTLGNLPNYTRPSIEVFLGVVTHVKSSNKRNRRLISLTIDDTTGFADFRLSPDMAKSVDKRTAMNQIKTLYMKGELNIKRELFDQVKVDQKPFDMPQVGEIYMFKTRVFPSGDESPPGFSVVGMKRVNLSHSGEVPLKIALNLRKVIDPEKTKRTRRKHFKQEFLDFLKNHRGDTPCLFAEYDPKSSKLLADLYDPIENYENAIEISHQEGRALSTPSERAWPPDLRAWKTIQAPSIPTGASARDIASRLDYSGTIGGVRISLDTSDEALVELAHIVGDDNVSFGI